MRDIFQNMKAVHLRQQGHTITEIQNLTKIPRSTLHDWFKHICLKESAKQIINERKKQANANARLAAYLKKRGFAS